MREFEKIPQRDFNETRAYCDHELAITVDGNGGVCEMSVIDCYEHEGTVYPDVIPLPILSRERGQYLGRPLYGPAIQIYTVTSDLRALPHRPTEQTISPWSLTGGDLEQNYSLMLDEGRLLWKLQCHAKEREKLLWCFQPCTLFCGKKDVYIEQHRGMDLTQGGDLYTPEEMANMADFPRVNGVANVTWQEEVFDLEKQVLFFRGRINYPFGEREYYLAVGGNAQLSYRTAKGMSMLCVNWEDRESITIGMALGKTRESAVASLRSGVNHFDSIRQAKVARAEKIERHALTVHTEKLPYASGFCQMSAQYLESLLVGKTTDGYIGVRAAAQKFGYFSLWDTIYPIRDLLWNGRSEEACRHIRYLLKLPMMENTPISSLHAIIEWNEVRAFCPDKSLEDLYPELLKMFRLAKRSTEPRYHLLKYTGNVGVDKPEELGLTEAFLAPEVNALWYMAARIVRNEALCQGDAETVEQADAIVAGIEKGYRKVFFAEDVGYLRAAADCNLQPAPYEVYQNSNTMGYDYPLGMYLMRNMVKPLAAYQSHQLWHPLGHVAVAFNSEVPCEMWKHVHMNHHNGHEMKLQRMAGNMTEVYRVLNEYLKVFDRWIVAQETNNYSRFAIHESQVCNWQTFSATANMEALRAAVAGIIKHRGGISYLPADDNEKVIVEAVPNLAGRMCITVEGTGAYGLMKADEDTIYGTLQLPSDVECEQLTILRTSELPEHPVLVYALDLPIRQVVAKETRLQFICDETAYAPICLLCKECPTITVNDLLVDTEWHENEKTVYIDRLWHSGDVIKVRLERRNEVE